MKTLKTIILTVVLMSISFALTAQVAINTDGSNPDGSAMLDVQSDTAGILIPRITKTQRNAISNPATGLMIFQTDSVTGFYHFNGADWKVVGSGAFAIDDLADGKSNGSSIFLGDSAGLNDMGKIKYNIGIGFSALKSNFDGSHNIAIGKDALSLNDGGDYNTAVGSFTLASNIIGLDNTAIGYLALQKAVGNANTAVGSGSFILNTTGNGNTALGYHTELFNIEGSNNTVIGYEAGMGTSYHNKSGNIFLGYKAGYYETGDNRLYIENSNSSAPLIYGEFDNDFIKINGNLEVSGTTTIDFGIDDLSDGRADGSSVFLGEDAGLSDDGTDNYNVAVGYNSMYFNTIGEGNTALGKNSSKYNTTGHNNVAIGSGSNSYNEEGSYNTVIGNHAGSGPSLHNKSGNVFLGYSAGYNETGDSKLYIENSSSTTPLIYGEFDNDIVKINGDLEVTGAFVGIGIDDLFDGKTDGSSVFLGEDAGLSDDGTDNNNVAVGDYSMYSNTEGYWNTASGYQSLYSNTSGFGNTVNGYGSLYTNTAGYYNVALGSFALQYNTIGNNNTAIGSGADKFNQEGSNNTVIGCEAGMGTSYLSKSGNVFLGYSAGYNETGDNKLYIENSQSSTPLIYGDFDDNILTVNGKLGIGTTSPDVQLHIINGTDASLAGGGYLVSGLTSGQNIVIDENEIMARNNGAISSLYLQRDGGVFNLHFGLAESNEFAVAADGKTGIGENAPTAKLHINTISGEDGLRVQIDGETKLKVASNGGVAVGYNPTAPTFALQLQNSSTDLLGRGIAYSWTTYSDGRLKTEQKELGYGLKEVMQLQPKSYFHHDSETLEDGTLIMVGSQKTHTFGFIAQELNQIIPEAVYVPKDETKDLWAIDYEKIIPVLTKAIQEQQAQIENQQEMLAGQKQMIEDLIQQVKTLKRE